MLAYRKLSAYIVILIFYCATGSCKDQEQVSCGQPKSVDVMNLGAHFQRATAEPGPVSTPTVGWRSSNASANFTRTRRLVRKMTSINKIVGGVDVLDPSGGEICWQATLIMRDAQTKEAMGFCGGSIVGARTIITAGHCILAENGVMKPEDVQVYVGVLSRNSDFSAKPLLNVVDGCGGAVDVQRIVKHPRYNQNTFNYDIALLILKIPLNFSRSCICPLCLENKEPTVGEVCAVSGYGIELTDEDAPERAQVPLKWLAVNVQNNQEPTCMLDGADAKALICAGSQIGEDSCSGDSGGPLVCWDGIRTHSYYLAGVVSYGPSPCANGQGAQYTKVASYFRWMVDNSMGTMRII